jgi:hypothetical protein
MVARNDFILHLNLVNAKILPYKLADLKISFFDMYRIRIFCASGIFVLSGMYQFRVENFFAPKKAGKMPNT